jgi:hypothetical protein
MSEQKPELWIYFSIFTRDKATQAKAIFKAYELEPTNLLVQEHLIKLYFRLGQYSKAFKMIVGSCAQKAKDEVSKREL